MLFNKDNLSNLLVRFLQHRSVMEMMLNATYHYKRQLLLDDLLGWHRALFPNGYSGLYRIEANSIINDSQGPM